MTPKLAKADDTNTPPSNEPKTRHFESYVGVDAGGTHWLAYSGLTVAPFSDMHQDGIRLRFTGGYGGYRYKSARTTGSGSHLVDHAVTTRFSEAMVGYQFKIANLTTKALIGITEISHFASPADPGNQVQGTDVGARGALELWLDISLEWYGALDLSYTTAHDTRSARLRIGHRLNPFVSVGVEARLNQDAEADFKISEADVADRQKPLDYSWAGAFARYEWSTGEISASGGLNAADLETTAAFEGEEDLGFYGTLNVLMRF